jgi:tetratricopeptide (TPR) repeat protein
MQAEAPEGALGVSSALLGEPLQDAFRLLSVFPATFDTEAAAAIWQVPPELAQQRLAYLARRSLVEGEDGRCSLHDLARAFAAAHASKAEREAASLRHAQHYRGVLQRLNALYERDAAGVRESLAAFDREWPNVRAAWEWIEHSASRSQALNGLRSDIPNIATDLFDLRLLPRERIRWHEAGLQAARAAANRREESTHLRMLGNAHQDLGETRRAIKHYEQSLAIAREIGDRRGEGRALGNMGNSYANLGETRRAIELLEQRREIAREISDRRSESIALGNLGNAYHSLGETQRAIELYEQHLSIAREIGDRAGEGRAIGNMGTAYASRGETRLAIELYERHLEISREIADRNCEGWASWNLGLLYEGEGDFARAADLMQVLVDFEREIGHGNMEKHATYLASLRARIRETGE